MRFLILAAIILLSPLTGFASTPDKQNLLTRPDLVFLADQSTGLNIDSALQIKDENLETSARIALSSNEQAELVFAFSNSTVTPTSLKLFAEGIDRNQASIEILVSEDGPDTGYLSLRAEPIRAGGSWQRFTFEEAAAQWLMIKISPFADPIDFNLKELEVEGYNGSPVSLYAFDEAPSDAIDVLKGLEQVDLAFDIHPDEKALLEDAEDGQLDNWSFAEASLISSGIHDREQRAVLLDQLDKLTSEAQTVTASEDSAFAKGRVLLSWLHKGVMKEGYVERQTNMSVVLQEKQFNCVSSATLYNIIGRRLGLDTRGIEVPDHAFTILYDGTNHVDVETTTTRGFDPARNRAALNAFSRTTGYTYISDKNRSKRRELDDAGMVALTYYNQGVAATEEDDFATALLFYFRALSLDPRNKSAIKNTLAVLGRWSHNAIDKEDYWLAVKVIDAALSFAPSDRASRHNMRFALTKAMLSADSADETNKMVAFAQELYTRTEDKTFLRLQSRALQRKAYEFVQQGKFEEALALTESLDSNTDDSTRRSIERLRISLFLNWSSEFLDAGEFAQAIDVLDRAYKERPTDYRVKNNISFTAQEWAASMTTAGDAQGSQSVLMDLSTRFPKIKRLQRISARNYDIDARAAYDAGDFESAIDIYQSAQKLGINTSTMKQNEKVAWNKWGLTRMDQNDYPGALAVFEKALLAHPRYSKFTNNVAYVVQEWAKAFAGEGNILDAEQTIAIQSKRFSAIPKIGRMQGNFVNNAVNGASSTQDFESLASTVKKVSELIDRKSRVDQLVGVFYQNWAKAVDPDLALEETLTILQTGFDSYPQNRHLKKMFVYAVNKQGDEAIKETDWQQAMSIFQSASRSLPGERTFKRKLEQVNKQL